MGPEYIKSIKKKTNNKFWLDTFDAWYIVLNNQITETNTQLLTAPLWYNNILSKELMFDENWHSKGIMTVSDVLTESGTFLSTDQLQDMYRLRSLNFLFYLRVKKNVQKFVVDPQRLTNCCLLKPFIPNHIKPILRYNMGTKDIYRFLMYTKKNEHTMKQKWSRDLNKQFNEKEWDLIFKICFEIVHNNNLKWFQLKILYRILGTNEYLHKIRLKESPHCLRCPNENETILHLFARCSEVKSFWKTIEEYIYRKINFKIKFTDCIIIFGYNFQDQNSVPLNILILATKKYLSKTTNNRLSLLALQRKLSEIYADEYLISKLAGNEETFSQIGQKWLPVFR